tara:strand:+ start:468 stop:662 length:195 start_codon:yes stop_codon:yes gene_type:complete
MATKIDYNQLQSLCSTEESMDLGPLVEKFKACDLHCIEANGHDLKELNVVLNKPQRSMESLLLL